MGTSRPATMCSSPLRKRSIWPWRVISPSGKMQTSSPSCRACGRCSKEWMMALGLSRSEMGTAPMARKSQWSTGRS